MKRRTACHDTAYLRRVTHSKSMHWHVGGSNRGGKHPGQTARLQRGGRYGLQPVHTHGETLRPSGPDVCSPDLVLRKTAPQGLKATCMATFMPGDKSPA